MALYFQSGTIFLKRKFQFWDSEITLWFPRATQRRRKCSCHFCSTRHLSLIDVMLAFLSLSFMAVVSSSDRIPSYRIILSHSTAAAAIRALRTVPASSFFRDAHHSFLPPQVLSSDLLSKAVQWSCLCLHHLLLLLLPSICGFHSDLSSPLRRPRAACGGGGSFSFGRLPLRPSSKKALLSVQPHPALALRDVSLMIYLLWQRLIC